MTAVPVLRMQLLVYRHGTTLVRGLLILSLVAGGMAGYTAGNPEQTTRTAETNVEIVETSVSHSAVVENGGDIWPNGTRLRDRSVYFSDVSPRLRLDATTTVPAEEPVSVAHRLVVNITATRGGTAFFQNRTVLAADEERVSNGTVGQTAEINVSGVRTRMADLRDTFGGVSRVAVTVKYVVEYDTGTYRNTLTASSPLEFEAAGDGYWLAEPLAASERHAQIRSTATESVDWTTVVWLSAAAVLAFVLAVGTRLYARREIDPDALLLELHSRQMSEWISDGELPMGLGSEHVRLKSLQDVVDIGIDNEKRVVHDDRIDVYAVIDGEVVYYYSDKSAWHDLPQFSIDDVQDATFIETHQADETSEVDKTDEGDETSEEDRTDEVDETDEGDETSEDSGWVFPDDPNREDTGDDHDTESK